jgi:hypothetical protein
MLNGEKVSAQGPAHDGVVHLALFAVQTDSDRRRVETEADQNAAFFNRKLLLVNIG